MSERERDIIADWLFKGADQTAVNVKFFRGSRDMITVEDFCKEVHSALMQKKLGSAVISETPPKSEQPKINVKELVATL